MAPPNPHPNLPSAPPYIPSRSTAHGTPVHGPPPLLPGGTQVPDECSQHHHRFLRPGALAWLRNSKIIARSLRSAATSASPVRLLPPSSLAPSFAPVSATEDGGGVPYFLGSVRGLWYPLRKKLAAAKSVVFLPPPSPDAAEVFLDTFVAAPSELVATH